MASLYSFFAPVSTEEHHRIMESSRLANTVTRGVTKAALKRPPGRPRKHQLEPRQESVAPSTGVGYETAPATGKDLAKQIRRHYTFTRIIMLRPNEVKTALSGF